MKRLALVVALSSLFCAAGIAAKPNTERAPAGPVRGANQPAELQVEAPADPSLVAEVSRLVEASLEALRDRRDHRHQVFLKESLAKLPGFAPARWHSGYVQLGGEWAHVDQVPYLAGDNPALAQYAELREKADRSHYPTETVAEMSRVQLVNREYNVQRELTPIRRAAPVQAAAGGATGAPRVGRNLRITRELREQLDTYAHERLRLINTAGYSTGYARAQESLARWCAQNGLTEEARVHWAQVFQQEPAHGEAAAALGLVKVGGRFVARHQVERAKSIERDTLRSLETWQAKLAGLQKQAASPEKSVRQAALGELRAIDDPNSVHALQRVTFSQWARSARRRDHADAFDREVVAVIGKFDTQSSTEALVRFAIRHDQDTVRRAAADQLKTRELRSYVPFLLDGLTMPMEYDVQVVENLLGQKQVVAEASQEHSNHIAGLRDARQVYNDKHLIQLTAAAEARVKQVQAFNRQAGELNARIVAALARAVDIDREGPFRDLVFAAELGAADPKRWWQWWYDHNEQYVSDDKPYYGYDYGWSAFDDYRQSYRESVAPMSCFLKGTPVWTLSGPKPIENVKVGDRVLAQHPETGELTFKGVLTTTLRPPSEMLTIRAGKSAITTTLGHPFFVVGKGWRMAKELKDDDWVYAQGQTLPIDRIEKAASAEAHNLTVADFGTYFVGKDRILVHDNSPIPPARLEMPGLLVTARQ